MRHDEQGQFDGSDEVDHEPVVRPYAMTQGRTKPRVDVDLLAFVHRTGPMDPLRDRGEHLQLLAACNDPVPAIELIDVIGRAPFNLPLEAARVILGELAAQRRVTITAPANPAPEAATLEKLLRGLQTL
ncbi:MAG: DUF742 domain-containing protein [Micromonosporaceae bacterium]